MDFEAHNEEVRAMWRAFHAREPYRIPITLGTNTRYFMLNPDCDPERTRFEPYSNDPDLMYETQLRFQRWSRFNLLQDTELGLPERWGIGVDFQNYYEAAWFGCPIEFMDDQVPDTLPAFAECPERVMENGLPDPFGGIYGKAKAFFEAMREKAAREGFMDRPVDVFAPGGWTDGPFTAACNLFSPAVACEMMADEPERLGRLLDFITEALILHMRAWRDFMGLEGKADGFGIADDSIALISTAMYREHILPLHRRMFDEFGTEKGRSIHLCGNSQRHFKTIADELKVQAFDTGFPIDFRRLRDELGPDVHISGGPHVELLLSGTPESVRIESKRILESGILEGGRFNLREGNNLAPHTPLENTEAMYYAGREFGKLTH